MPPPDRNGRIRNELPDWVAICQMSDFMRKNGLLSLRIKLSLEIRWQTNRRTKNSEGDRRCNPWRGDDSDLPSESEPLGEGPCRGVQRSVGHLDSTTAHEEKNGPDKYKARQKNERS